MRDLLSDPSPFLLSHLQSGRTMVAVELRPPRAELETGAGMDAWIDTYHAVRGLTRRGTPVFLTDSAVGAQEEDNLRHLITNLNHDVPRERIVPFLTTKHSLEYCLSYADRAQENGFQTLVVLGGDKSIGPPRCVPHAWQLRKMIRERTPDLVLGGWANPHRDADRQAEYLSSPDFCAEFFLTQIVSHHHAEAVSAFLASTARLELPGVFGVFYYRSANPRTLEKLRAFLPVPVEELKAEFAGGATAEDICARTIRTLFDLGVRHFYVSNLPIDRAAPVLHDVLSRAGIDQSVSIG